jgi:hypothetical protein
MFTKTSRPSTLCDHPARLTSCLRRLACITQSRCGLFLLASSDWPARLRINGCVFRDGIADQANATVPERGQTCHVPLEMVLNRFMAQSRRGDNLVKRVWWTMRTSLDTDGSFGETLLKLGGKSSRTTLICVSVFVLHVARGPCAPEDRGEGSGGSPDLLKTSAVAGVRAADDAELLAALSAFALELVFLAFGIRISHFARRPR